MFKKYLPNIKLVGLHTMALYSMNAYASFNSFGSSPLCRDFIDCFILFNVLGFIGIPIFVAISLIFHLLSGGNQVGRAVLNGIIAFEIVAIVASVIFG